MLDRLSDVRYYEVMNETRRCEDCNRFITVEPTEVIDIGWAYGESAADSFYEVEEHRACSCGHDNVERVAA